ncbi:alpha/beta-hydrolase [Myriangium duriaei CBS 260.36]|uniref:Carboxylic ester hydrolase n=1 Tax=Myriangium duriaei CBS 260.36 TaxID=1168546 RepID=A0A9P4MSL6_9PEZI|nr:alpha/beta-hydrolase [Myriangium duriaei CBS 260.36]
MAAVTILNVVDAKNSLIVTSPSGTYIGLVNGTAPDVRQFLSIPYASPPVGHRRWLPPEAHSADSSVVRDATHFPPSCAQYRMSTPSLWNTFVPEWLIRTPDQNFTAGAYAAGTQEDCLYLGIWTPVRCAGKLPVIVFIPGGAFAVGGVDIPYQLPHHWVQRTQSHIVVTINYRVGVMGFPNAAGLEQNNLGLLDQRAALEWVRDNIEAFGGDSERITLWGQSAGAASVEYQSFIKPQDPIVQGYIQTSGTVYLGLVTDDPNHSQFSTLAKQVGCGTFNSPEKELDCMRTLSVEKIVTASNTLTGARFLPTVDNMTVYSDYTDRYGQGLFAQKPAIVSFCTRDGVAGLQFSSANHIQAPDETTLDAVTEVAFGCPAAKTAHLRSKFVNATYRYQYDGNFTNVSPVPWLGAYHDSDLALIFGTHQDFRGPSTAYEYQVSHSMQDHMLAFMRDPLSATSMTGWPTVSSGQMLRFGALGESAAQNVQQASVDTQCLTGDSRLLL